MRNLLVCLLAIPMLAACGGDDSDKPDSCGSNAAPTTYKGGAMKTCSGTDKDAYACCVYVADKCAYSVCRESTCGKWEEKAWSCD
ncbi:hypothetical protein JGU66_05490 [Myxococcaceae bacterium JPH2]|nr:hypothetical protein [Myxococcaceae bacterium JPH2]